MKIVDNRTVKSVPFGYIRFCEVFRPVDSETYDATAYMRIPEVEDVGGICFNTIDLDYGYLISVNDSEQVELLNATLHIDPKGE